MATMDEIRQLQKLGRPSIGQQATNIMRELGASLQGQQLQQQQEDTFARDILAKQILAEEDQRRKLELEEQKAKLKGEQQSGFQVVQFPTGGFGVIPTAGQGQQNQQAQPAIPTTAEPAAKAPAITGVPPTERTPLEGSAAGKVLGQTPESKIQQSIFKETTTALQKSKVKTFDEIQKAGQDFSTIAGSAQRLIDRYVEGFKEGGIGNLARAKASDVADVVGGGFGDKFAASNAFKGQKGEMALKMMPLITGSVRIIRSVFSFLLDSLPSKNSSPKTAKEKIEQTIENVFGFSKAVKDRGLTANDINNLNDVDLENLGSELINQAGSFEFTKEEKEALDKVKATITKKLDEVISGREGKKGNAQTLQRLGLDPNRFEIIGSE